MKNLIKIAIVIVFPALFLAACGEGAGSSVSGVGSTLDGRTNGGALNDLYPELGTDTGAGNNVPIEGGSCKALGFTYVPPLIGCSQQSYIECKCYDPLDEKQPKK